MSETIEQTPQQKSERSEEEWRAVLSPQQYDVLRLAGTERPWSGEYVSEHADGVYHCAACDAPLFHSDAKYDSRSGWPSFMEPVSPTALELREDRSNGMRRVEVRCATCASHLGHVFPDGPGPTGERFCMNSVSLDLKRA